MNIKRILVLSIIAVLLVGAAQADVKVTNIFGDHMVLQRGIKAPVFGTADPGEKVTVKFGAAVATATADSAGKWMVYLPAMKANANPQVLTISGKNTVTVNDVLVGDVWLCGGQSNMEWGLGGCNDPQEVASANYPTLRRIKMDHKAPDQPSNEVPGTWQVCTPQTAPGFTAVGYYFARIIQKQTGGTPIGLLDCNWGGTRIEPWIAPAGYAMEPTLSAKMPGDASKMYFGMISPMVPFAIKGALWYQGESNGGEGDEYFVKMRALINGWRKVFNIDFPFYYVQLANFQNPGTNPEGGDGWARVRMAQTKALTIPKTGMCVAIDMADPGNPGDIHPKDKYDVAYRLAQWSLRNDYGKKIKAVSGPLFKSMTVKGDKAIINFVSTGSGLVTGKKEGRAPFQVVPGAKLERFAVAGADKKWYWANAVIEGNTVVVSAPEVPKPVAVRYAYTMNPAGANLYNKEGLPASPFRTDDW